MKRTAATLRAAAIIRSASPTLEAEDPAGFAGAVDDLLDDWECEAAQERAERGIPEDSPTVANCDDWGTGEGRYHGRI